MTWAVRNYPIRYALCLSHRLRLWARSAVSDRAARTNCLQSNPAELFGSFRTTLTTKESARSNPEKPIEDTGNRRFHKTIYSIQGGGRYCCGDTGRSTAAKFRDVFGRLANGKASSCLKLVIHMPERIVGGLSSEREQNQLWKLELQPKTSCVGEARPFVIRRNMRADPAMFSNLFNKMLLVFVKLRRIRVESRAHSNTPFCCFKSSGYTMAWCNVSWQSSTAHAGFV